MFGEKYVFIIRMVFEFCYDVNEVNMMLVEVYVDSGFV